MANVVFNYTKRAFLVGSFNLQGTPTLWAMLVGSGYTPDNDLHVYRSSVTNEITGSNYVAGGFALSSPLVTTNNTDNTGVLDASDILIANITFNTAAQAAVIYGSTGLGIASDPLVAYIDFTTGQSVTAGTFQIQWNASGILAIT